MLNDVQHSALFKVAAGERIHRTTAEALNRKRLIERGPPFGALRLTVKGARYLSTEKD